MLSFLIFIWFLFLPSSRHFLSLPAFSFHSSFFRLFLSASIISFLHQSGLFIFLNTTFNLVSHLLLRRFNFRSNPFPDLFYFLPFLHILLIFFFLSLSRHSVLFPTLLHFFFIPIFFFQQKFPPFFTFIVFFLFYLTRNFPLSLSISTLFFISSFRSFFNILSSLSFSLSIFFAFIFF